MRAVLLAEMQSSNYLDTLHLIKYVYMCMFRCLLDQTGFVGRYLSDVKFRDFWFGFFGGVFCLVLFFSVISTTVQSYSQPARVQLRLC